MATDSGQEQEGDWQPTKEFLTSTPRSSQIREVCLGIVNRLNALLHDPEIAQNTDRQSQLYAELEAQGGKLIELGIKPDMHVGQPLEAYKSNPVTAMEYVAGQLYETTGHKVVSESQSMPIIQEFSETRLGRAHLIPNADQIPNKMKDLMVMRSMVNVGYSFLDAQPDEKQLQ